MWHTLVNVSWIVLSLAWGSVVGAWAAKRHSQPEYRYQCSEGRCGFEAFSNHYGNILSIEDSHLKAVHNLRS